MVYDGICEQNDGKWLYTIDVNKFLVYDGILPAINMMPVPFQQFWMFNLWPF